MKSNYDRLLITFSLTANVIRKKTKDEDHVDCLAFNPAKRNNLRNEMSQRSIIRDCKNDFTSTF